MEQGTVILQTLLSVMMAAPDSEIGFICNQNNYLDKDTYLQHLASARKRWALAMMKEASK